MVCGISSGSGSGCGNNSNITLPLPASNVTFTSSDNMAQTLQTYVQGLYDDFKVDF
jgi:hypothetical protein